jgi:hypothetical protein
MAIYVGDLLAEESESNDRAISQRNRDFSAESGLTEQFAEGRKPLKLQAVADGA